MLSIVLALIQTPTSPPAWMAGYWLSCEDGRETSETWSDPRAGLMVGYGMTVARGRASFELFRIAPHGDGVAYIAQPNGAEPVIFPAVEVTAVEARFSNPRHDFPQVITYRREGDVLIARIEGEMDGEAASMEWRYRSAELNSRCPSDSAPG